MKVNNYLIIGASGLIGSRVAKLLKGNILTPDEKEVDITDPSSVKKYFEEKKDRFNAIINFAAFTDVDRAEEQRGDENGFAWRLNVEGSKNLAKLAKEFGKFQIQISTDFVFPGTEEEQGPYSEDATTPKDYKKLGWYGWTKLQAEKEVMKLNPSSCIVRTAYPFYAAKYELKTDFAKKILELFDAGTLYPLFEDQVLNPLYVDYFPQAVEKIVDVGKQDIYHVVTKDTCTYWEFGSYLIEKARGVKNAPKKGSMKEFLKAPGRTPRPRLGGLKTQYTQNKLGMKFKTWRQAVDTFVEELKTS